MAVTVFKLILAMMGVYLLALLIAAFAVKTDRIYTDYSPLYRFLLLSATDLTMLFCRVKTEIDGIDKLPEGPFLLICNHRSKFDPLVTWKALRRRKIAFITKPENLKIPVFGRIVRRCCFLPIDRESPRNAMETVKEAVALLQKGDFSVAVYPEGTRSFNGELLPFHSGMLKIAQKAGVPLVVATIDGTETIHKRAPFHRSVVHLDILEIINPEELSTQRSTELGEQARAMMEKHLNQIKAV